MQFNIASGNLRRKSPFRINFLTKKLLLSISSCIMKKILGYLLLRSPAHEDIYEARD